MSIFDAMKKIFLACLMLAGASLLSGCFNDKGDDEPVYISVTAGAFILNQGNALEDIKGSITYIDFANSTSREITGLDLDYEPSDILAYGGKVYVACPSRNAIVVFDKETFAPIATISTTETLGNDAGEMPRHLTAYGKCVYVSTYGGYVGGIDTTNFQLLAKYQAGTYPEGMCIGEDDEVASLYVANSDADNGNGNISIINLKSGSINTVRNDNVQSPQKLAVAGSYIYVLDSGENFGVYKMYGSSAQKIIHNATEMTAAGYCLVTINAPQNGNYSFSLYDVRYGVPESFSLYGDDGHTLIDPIAIGVDPNTGYIMVASRQADPDEPGFVNLYNSTHDFVASYPIGIEATDISFQYRTARYFY